MSNYIDTMTDTTRHRQGQGGNTGNSPCPRRGRYWFFTLNNYKPEDIQTLETLNKCRYLFQEETGKDGTPHLQGIILFDNARTLEQMKLISSTAHWEFIRYKKKAIAYCSKVETRTGKVYQNMGVRIERPLNDPFLKHKPKTWQSKILKIIDQEPDLRKIHWFWESKGGTGKSLFSKHLILKHNALVIGGSKRDIQFGIMEWIKKQDLTLVIVDIPRCSYNKISYQALECIKNGFFFSTKYESGMCVFNTPHVIVFANSEPQYNNLSNDRWVIYDINEGYQSEDKEHDSIKSLT